MLGVVPGTEQISDRALFRRGWEPFHDRHVLLGQVTAVHSDALTSGLLALRQGDFVLVVQEVAEVVQTRSGGVRHHPRGDRVLESFLCGPGGVQG